MTFLKPIINSFHDYSLIWIAIAILLFVTFFSYFHDKISPNKNSSSLRIVGITFITITVFFLGGLLMLMFAFTHGI